MATGCSCEYEFMEYMNEDSIDHNLICSICHKPLKDPFCTPCDHTYGRGCIEYWLTTSINYSCPTCQKQPLLIKDLTQASRPLRNILDQFPVRCILCEQTGIQRGNFQDHVDKVCPKAIVECRAADIKCPWKGSRDELDNHVSTCIFEPLRPVLASLIADNRQLVDQVQKHDKEIKNLTKKMSQMSSKMVDKSDDECDVSSVSELSINNDNQKEENAIFIRNLPATAQFKDVFDVFEKVGRIKYNIIHKRADVFIFKNPNKKDGFCNAKVVYADKESAAAAVAKYNGQHIPQWNTRVQVCISDSKKRNLRDFGKANNEGNVGAQHESETMRSSDTGSKTSYTTDQAQSPPERSQAPPLMKNTRNSSHHSHQRPKPTN